MSVASERVRRVNREREQRMVRQRSQMETRN